jgi:hypothetical protein
MQVVAYDGGPAAAAPGLYATNCMGWDGAVPARGPLGQGRLVEVVKQVGWIRIDRRRAATEWRLDDIGSDLEDFTSSADAAKATSRT